MGPVSLGYPSPQASSPAQPQPQTRQQQQEEEISPPQGVHGPVTQLLLTNVKSETAEEGDAVGFAPKAKLEEIRVHFWKKSQCISLISPKVICTKQLQEVHWNGR